VRMMKIFSTHLFHSSPLLLMTSYKNHIHTYTYIHIYTHMHTNTFIHTQLLSKLKPSQWEKKLENLERTEEDSSSQFPLGTVPSSI
jgi:hypothetical protein